VELKLEEENDQGK